MRLPGSTVRELRAHRDALYVRTEALLATNRGLVERNAYLEGVILQVAQAIRPPSMPTSRFGERPLRPDHPGA